MNYLEKNSFASLTTTFSQIRIKYLLKIFLKSNKNRLIIIFICFTLIVSILTSFLLIWYSNQYYEFDSFLTKSGNWNNNQKISSYYSTIEINFVPNYAEDYLDRFVIQAMDSYNEIITEIANNNVSALMSSEIYFKDNSTEITKCEFLTMNDNLTEILSNNLIKGRMPENSSEIIYCIRDDTIIREINDKIIFQTTTEGETYSQNLSIVGIVKNLAYSVAENGYSQDLFNWRNYIENYRYMFSSQESFITSQTFYFDILNNFPILNNGRAVMVDFNYNSEQINIRKLSLYLNNYQKQIGSNFQLMIDPEVEISLGEDLFALLANFNIYWIQETLKSFIICLPIIFPIFLISIEMYKIGEPQLESNIKKMKMSGIENSKINNTLLVKNLLVAVNSSFFGIIFGIIFGYLFVINYEYGISLNNYISGLGESFIIIILITILFCLILISIVMELTIARRIQTANPKDKDLKSKFKFRKIFSFMELLLIGLGTLLITPGIIIVRIIPVRDLDIGSYSLIQNLIAIIGWVVLYIGIVIATSVLLLFILKAVILIYVSFGEKKWLERKSNITLALKSIQINKKHYEKFAMILALISIAFIPGIFIGTSIEKHIVLESNLSIGCADILIPNWGSYNYSQVEIENINGIDKSTVVSHYYGE